MKGSINKCRWCGKPIGVITWGIYRKTVVDADAVMVKPDPEGEQFVRIDGSKLQGLAVEFEDAVDAEPAYRPHRVSCGVQG